MRKQKCVRTYHGAGYKAEVGCRDLNSYLECGWEVVMVIPVSSSDKYVVNEYIIEKECDDSKEEIEK